MLKNRRKIILSLICIVILFFVGYRIMSKNSNNITFTETVIANAKSEKVSMPYINPEWTEYMKMSEEEKTEVENIPEMYIYDYIPEENLYGDYSTLPEKLNLRDEYPTTLYDQGNEGLCWAYATVTMLESHLKVNQNIDEQFSIDQLDCLISSSDYYINKYNPYSFNKMKSGGLSYSANVGFHNSILGSGVVPIKASKFHVDKNKEMNISDVANIDNVDYTIKETVTFPTYENTEEYKNMLKSFIKKYGAVKIYTVAPSAYEGNVIDFQWGDDKSWDLLTSRRTCYVYYRLG